MEENYYSKGFFLHLKLCVLKQLLLLKYITQEEKVEKKEGRTRERVRRRGEITYLQID